MKKEDDNMFNEDEEIPQNDKDLDQELDDEINDQQDEFNDDFNDNDDLDSYGGDFSDGGDIPLNKHNDLLRSLTDFDPYLRDMFNNWLGLKWDEEEKKFTNDPLVNPIMNLNCAMWCLRFLKNYARKNNIITDISSSDYKDINEDMINELWYNLGTRDDFGIREEGDLIALCTELEHSAKLVLMGAGDGRYNKLLQTTINRQESIQLRDDDGRNIEVVQQPKKSKLRQLILG